MNDKDKSETEKLIRDYQRQMRKMKNQHKNCCLFYLVCVLFCVMSMILLSCRFKELNDIILNKNWNYVYAMGAEDVAYCDTDNFE